jgi:hypothetical protein
MPRQIPGRSPDTAAHIHYLHTGPPAELVEQRRGSHPTTDVELIPRREVIGINRIG